MKEKIDIIEPISGFTEREKNSKALLNTDMESLLKYKIQRRKFAEINKSNGEINSMKNDINNMKTEMNDEINSLKNDLVEIKELLLQITKR